MLSDLKFALRALRRSPGFTIAALATLGLGIAANATVFGVVNAVLLRAYPFREPDRLVAVYERNVRSLERGGRMPLSLQTIIEVVAIGVDVAHLSPRA